MLKPLVLLKPHCSMMAVACLVILVSLAQVLTGGGDEFGSSTSDGQNSTLLAVTTDRSRKVEDSCLDRLHKEIGEFYEFMKLTEEERQDREVVLQRLNDTILGLWPTAEIKVFGSYYTGLSLPTSDIDLTVFGNFTDESPLNTLEEAIVKSKISKHEQNIILPNISVPIIKIYNQLCHVKVDIVFRESGINQSKLVREYCKRFPMLAKLVLILKQLLLKNHLNNGNAGGIPSYGIVLITTTFLQLHPNRNEDSFAEENLGGLLMDFLDLYGRKFDYNNTAIRVKDGGAFLPKEEVEKGLKGQKCNIMCIEDPLIEGIDVTRNTKHVYEIKHVFEDAYLMLQQTIKSSNCTSQKNSILEQIVKIPDEVISYRNRVRDGSCNIGVPQSSGPSPM